MRWLLVHPGPSFSVADVHNGWSEALRGLGEDVMEYNLDARLTFFDSALIGDENAEPDAEGRKPARKALTSEQAVELAVDGILGAVYRWWPHVVVCVSAFFMTPFVLEVMRARGHKIVMLFTEAPYQTNQQLEMAKYADISIVNDPVGLDQYQAASGTAYYQPHSYRPAVHYPSRARKLHDLAFVGSGFRSRIEFFEAMQLGGLDVALGGFWSGLAPGSPLRPYLLSGADADACIDNPQTADLYRRARTGINFYRREAEDDWAGQGWACGPREIELAACGTWFARDPRPESDELFGMLPSFAGPGEAGEQIRWALAHPRKRQEAARQARAAVEDRTFENAAKRLLSLLGKLGQRGENGTSSRPQRQDLFGRDQRRGGVAAAVPGVLGDQPGDRQAGRHRLR